MQIVDAHLDLAFNVMEGRNVLLPAREQAAQLRDTRDGIPTVGLPDLHAGGVAMICATIYCSPWSDRSPEGYRTPEQANRAARQQLDWYTAQRNSNALRLVTRASDLPRAESSGTSPLPAILLLEGADPILSPTDAKWWFEAGVRIVGLAWRQTRYAGGTGTPGPLSSEGVEMVRALDGLGMIHDASHLAEESFWQLMDLSHGPVIASHSNCRAIVPTDRQLSDDMVRAIGKRGGVIGINFFDKFLQSPDVYGTARATLADVVRHVKHLCDLLGNVGQVGLGTDMDGGLGRDEIPAEIITSADLPRVGEALAKAGFGDLDVARIMGQNWLDYFSRTLVAAAR